MNKTRRTLRYLAMVALVIALATVATLLLRRPHAVTLFEDVTPYSGISYVGITYGAAWGDFDGDGLPDLYITDHLNRAKLFRNLGKGHFADVTDKFFAAKDLMGDKHGAAWADFDNDGRLDLVQLTGAARGVGSEAKQLYINRGSRFEEAAELAGVSNPMGRARMPMWFDFNGDGQLDLFQGAETRFDNLAPPFVFIQQSGKFAASDRTLAIASRTAPFCIITALTNDNHSDLVCRVSAHTLTAQIFHAGTLPARELVHLPATAFEDVAAGDFNNDGFIDLYLARKNPPGPVAFGRPGINKVIADTLIDHANVDKPTGFHFRSSGNVTFNVSPVWPMDALSADQIYVGNLGMHPERLEFTLSPETAHVSGSVSYRPGSQSGLYVHLTPPDKWEVLVSGARDRLYGGRDKYQQVAVTLTSTEAIKDLGSIGDTIKPEEAPSRLFMNRAGKLVEESEKRGVNARPIAAVNVVAGDFNNDMNLDLFMVASDEIGKQENLLLLNQGDGYFKVVPGAGGAAGNRVGVGDSVTVCDYDRDGFLDLLIATGGSMGRSEGPPSESGTYHLYHGLGNGNHWIEIDLEGTKSNRDGIGARVYITTGGITQVRVQDGGVHYRGQNCQRIHFGLAKHTQIDTIKVYWPSGKIQELHKITADQIIRVKEPPESSTQNRPVAGK
jgi:hypothetical protein